VSRRRRNQSHKAPETIDIATAVEIADDADLPDGAWMAMIESLTGKDAGEIADWLAEHQDGAP